MSTTMKQYKRFEAQITKGDLDALQARWKFGRKLLDERGDAKRLPHGRMKQISNALLISRRELQNRMQFAAEYPTETKVRAAFKKYGSWSAICERGMGDRGTSLRSTSEQNLLGPVPDMLTVLTEVDHQLAAIETVDEAKGIHDPVEAARVYSVTAQRVLEVQNRCARVKIQAERRAGELVARIKRDGKHVGIAPTTAKRLQEMAQVPEPVVQKYVSELDARGYEVTSAGVRRMGRELRRGSLRADGDGTVRWSPDES